MANVLTGDYDAVAAFSLGAVNRILAAMHRGQRLPHSLSMAVDDFPTLHLGVAAVAIVSVRGEAIPDVRIVKRSAHALAVRGAPAEQVLRNVDPVVNWRADSVERREIAMPGAAARIPGPDSDYSFLAGVAQLQLGPPTMQLPPGQTDRADVHTPVMIHYKADDSTLPLSGAMRGDIVTTFGVRHTTSPAGTNIVVDVAGSQGGIHFNPAWTVNSLDANDRAAIDKALHKSLKQSFQPSSTLTPAGLLKAHFKGFPAAGAVAVLLNTTSQDNPGPASVGNVFLRAGDHFSLSVNGDRITGEFAAHVNAAISPRVQKSDTKVVIDYWVGTKTFHIYTTVTVLDATVTLGDIPFLNTPGVPGTGQILLTIPVQVRFGWENKPTVVPDPVDFDFTIVQAFALTLDGRHVGIQTVGDLAVNFPPGVPGNEETQARKQATTLFNKTWAGQQNQVSAKIDEALSADKLQKLLTDLMNPDSPVAGVETVTPDLEYTSFEIRPEGVILHGSLAVPPWPAAHCEFDKDPWAPVSSPEYNALRSWIPGGTIQAFDWKFQGTGALHDTNRFVTVNAQALTAGSNRVCLTFTGSRITAAGPVGYEPVDSGRRCKWTSFPLGMAAIGIDYSAGNRPHVGVPKPGTPQEGLEFVGHVSPWAEDGRAGGTANLLVHFPDEGSAARLEALPRALADSGRSDTATGIVCVLTREQLSTVRALDGLMYADDAEGWERLLEVRERPATVVLDPSGAVVWRHTGDIAGLADVLRQYLGRGGQFAPEFIQPSLTAGERSPNFLFEYGSGDRLTLRKLAGRPLALVFWRSVSAPSMATLANLHRAFESAKEDAPIILAINDGESGEFARGLAAIEAGEMIVVPDPARQISRAYGVSLWPTTVFLDAQGLVRDIRLGLISREDLETSVGSRPAPASANRGVRTDD